MIWASRFGAGLMSDNGDYRTLTRPYGLVYPIIVTLAS